jgi:hypothetical protein
MRLINPDIRKYGTLIYNSDGKTAGFGNPYQITVDVIEDAHDYVVVKFRPSKKVLGAHRIGLEPTYEPGFFVKFQIIKIVAHCRVEVREIERWTGRRSKKDGKYI